jgi:hypothetical protein
MVLILKINIESGIKSMFYFTKTSYVDNCQHFKKRYGICFIFINFMNFMNFQLYKLFRLNSIFCATLYKSFAILSD